MNCRETLPLLPLFVDGELDARQMRDVALHSTRCDACEQELRGIERVQDMVSGWVNSTVDEIGEVEIWPLLAPRIEAVRRPWGERILEWMESGQSYWLRVPVYAGVAAVLALLIARWFPGGDVQQQVRTMVDNSVIFDSVRSDAGSLALLSEPETNTMVLWVADEGPAVGDDLGGTP